MKIEKKREFCGLCGKNVMAERKKTNCFLHLCLMLLTAGLLSKFKDQLRKKQYHCPECGSVTNGISEAELIFMREAFSRNV